MDMRALMDGPDGFASSSTKMQAYAARTLEFLNIIEKTVRSLAADSEVVRILANEAKKTLEVVQQSKLEVALDPDGRICSLLDKAAASAARTYDDAVRSLDRARNDKALTDDDGVVEAFTNFIAEIADFHNAVEDLRDAVATIDSVREPSTGKVFESVDDLMAALTAK